MSEIRYVNPPVVFTPQAGSYSHVAVVPPGHEFYAIAGQVGLKLDGTIPDDPAEQYEIALTNIAAILKSQGLSLSDIVKLNTFVARDIDLTKVREIRNRIFGDIAPPNTWVYVVKLAMPQLAIEVEVLAAKKMR